MCSLCWKFSTLPILTKKRFTFTTKDSDAIFDYFETSRTHLTLIAFLAEIVDVFLQFNL